MAEPDQPKKETVRIQLPHPPVTKPSEPSVKPHETVRIQLPVRETGTPPVPSSSQSAPGEYFFHELFPAAEAASCLASVIGFSASSSDSTLCQDRKRRPCAFR